MSSKLYKITLKNLKEHYAIADEPTDAYEMVRNDLDNWGYYFSEDRSLRSIDLVAEDDQYTDCDTHLHI